MRGYIAMLAVREEYRGKGVATRLVRMAVDVMIERDADEVLASPEFRRWLMELCAEKLGCRSHSKRKLLTQLP